MHRTERGHPPLRYTMPAYPYAGPRAPTPAISNPQHTIAPFPQRTERTEQ
jgi:hypothetical protein